MSDLQAICLLSITYLQDVGYQAYGPPYGMYQPQPPPPAHVMDPSLAFNGLNVTGNKSKILDD